MTTTREALLAAVIAAPSDDTVRLIFADHLEGTGEPADAARAEFIRVQVDEANGIPHPTMRLWHLLHESADWFPAACGALRLERTDWGVMPNGTVHFESKHHTNEFFVRRGFVDEVRCPLAGWCGGRCPRCDVGPGVRRYATHGGDWIEDECNNCSGTGRTAGVGPALTQAHPLTRVVLTDREPRQTREDAWAWYYRFEGEPRCWVPSAIWVRLAQSYPRMTPDTGSGRLIYPTRDAAHAALSAAALTWAKALSSANPSVFAGPPDGANYAAAHAALAGFRAAAG